MTPFRNNLIPFYPTVLRVVANHPIYIESARQPRSRRVQADVRSAEGASGRIIPFPIRSGRPSR